MLSRILLILENPVLRKQLKALLKGEDVILEVIKSSQRLWERLSKESGDLVIVSRNIIPEPAEDTIRLIKDSPETPDVVITTDHDDPKERARLLAAGCEAVLFDHLPGEMFRDVLVTLIKKRHELIAKRITEKRYEGVPRLSDFVLSSPSMRTFMDVVEKVVTSDTSLLILGETGVGKERLARAIHTESRRSEGPFVAVNCGALPESLLESELFGHEEGAFTGASRSRRGWFELAHGGTAYLDEIGEMPLHLQVKMLRVLQEHVIQRMGGEKSIHVDVRVMASTNRNLAREIENGNFRQDLFYRLNVISLTIPPLRDRKEDVPMLIENYIEYFRNTIGRDVNEITSDAIEALVRYSWPGNIRELMNVVERAVLLCNEPTITLSDLPEEIGAEVGGMHSPLQALSASQVSSTVPDEWLSRPLREVRKEIVSEFERTYLEALLRDTGGRVGKTAERAGIEPRSLFEKMKRYDLRKEDFKPKKKTWSSR